MEEQAEMNNSSFSTIFETEAEILAIMSRAGVNMMDSQFTLPLSITDEQALNSIASSFARCLAQFQACDSHFKALKEKRIELKVALLGYEHQALKFVKELNCLRQFIQPDKTLQTKLQESIENMQSTEIRLSSARPQLDEKEFILREAEETLHDILLEFKKLSRTVPEQIGSLLHKVANLFARYH